MSRSRCQQRRYQMRRVPWPLDQQGANLPRIRPAGARPGDHPPTAGPDACAWRGGEPRARSRSPGTRRRSHRHLPRQVARRPLPVALRAALTGRIADRLTRDFSFRRSPRVSSAGLRRLLQRGPVPGCPRAARSPRRRRSRLALRHARRACGERASPARPGYVGPARPGRGRHQGSRSGADPVLHQAAGHLRPADRRLTARVSAPIVSPASARACCRAASRRASSRRSATAAWSSQIRFASTVAATWADAGPGSCWRNGPVTRGSPASRTRASPGW